MAFTYFRGRVKFAVLEVGLGGRLDATNIVRQKVSVITSIGLDHQQFLGDTLEQIAGEKAGIIKTDEPVIVGRDVHYAVIRERADSRLVNAESASLQARSRGGGYFEIDVQTPIRNYQSLRPSLAGRHQLENAVLAIRAAECLGWQAQQIRRGIEEAVWPGRLQSFSGEPSFILDGAHNPHAARALAAFLCEFYPEGVWMVFGAMADKKPDDMIELLKPWVRQWIFTKPDNARAQPPQDLATRIPGSLVCNSVTEAIRYSRQHAPKDLTVLICGSLYLVGEARAHLVTQK